MGGVEAFLEQYSLLAVFLLMLVKATGAPLPPPADVVMLVAAGAAAQGRLSLWGALAVVLLALLLGGLVQFALVRGPGRGVLYRYGRYLGLTSARLDAAAGTVRRGGPVGVAVAIVTPGVRAGAVAACGLAGLPLRTFLPGLLLGTTAFAGLHFAIGYTGGALLSGFLNAPLVWAGTAALLVVGFGVWVVLRRRQRPRATRGDVVADAVGAWHEAACPLCLVLGAAAGAREPQPAPATEAAGGPQSGNG